MKIAIYTRVSTDKQTHDSQLLELKEYCQRRGWQNVSEYSDVISLTSAIRTLACCNALCCKPGSQKVCTTPAHLPVYRLR